MQNNEEEQQLRSVAFLNARSIFLARQRAEESLRKQSELLRITLSSIGDAVISTDERGCVTFMNPVAEALTGWTQASAMGRLLTEVFKIISEDSTEPTDNPALRALREGTVVGLANHTVLISRDGTQRPIEDSAAPIRDDAGIPVGAVLVFRDVSERKASEVALAHLAAIVESSDDAIVSKSLNGIIRSWNSGAQRLFGYTAEEAIGNSITLIIPADRLDEERDILARISRGERVDHFETVRVARDGRKIDISLTISPIRDSSGRIVGASKVARDITDRRNAEAARVEADQRKDQFIALLAHELRNPLAPLRNGLQVIKLAGHDPKAVAQAGEMMDRQLEHMVRLIDDLLDISRITQNKMELRRARVLLTEVIRSAVETVRPAIEKAGHQFMVSLPRQEEIVLDADLTRLAQVFGNLLTNSTKFTSSGGQIWLTAERQGNEAVVSVKDTGIGIPVEALPNIFDMFSQVGRSIDPSAGGLGIGLALVKALVEMHGGTVHAESEGQGKGTTFTVRIPALAIETEAPEIAQSHGAEATETRQRVLIADDSQDSATSMGMLLKLLGNEVRVASNGAEAVAIAETFRPDVILMDLGMPELNGYEATQRIRREPWGQGIIIVALSGWGQERDRIRSREAGCDGHLVKPVTLPELENLLKELNGARTAGTPVNK